MDDVWIAELARSAGLGRALAAFPDEIRVAAIQARTYARTIQVPDDPASEPWPPMQPGVDL
jgi:hypothetical protein